MQSTWMHPGHLHHSLHNPVNLELPVTLDQDGCSEPGSVPLPNDDFEPFLADYTEYDQRLESTLSKVQDLGIPDGLNYTVYDPAVDGEFVITRSSRYYENEEPDSAWSSPTKNPPMPQEWSSPMRHPSPSRVPPPPPPAYPLSSPTRRSPGLSPEFFSPGMPSNALLFSPSHQPPAGDLNSSPPGSPSIRGSYRSVAPLGLDTDSLGIRHSFVKEEDSYDRHLNWQPILTIPAETQRESEKIIRSQRSTSELRTKRKSCLPPGTVDEYISGPEDGQYKCLYPHCNRLFRRKYNLKSHIQTHLCDRPYVCDSCDATFVRPHDLKRHELCHQTMRQFICPCGKGFTRMDAMHRHRSRQICTGGVSGPITKSSPKKRRPGRQPSSPTDTSSPSDFEPSPEL